MEMDTMNGKSIDCDLPEQILLLGWSPFFHHQLHQIASGYTPARIISVGKNRYLASQGNEEIQTTLAGRLLKDSPQGVPVVGDWVLLRDSLITRILQRKNCLTRKAAGGRTRRADETPAAGQVMAANLDMVFIVCGMDRDFNLRRIERYLTLVYNCGIEPIIVLTKADLHHNPDQCLHEVEAIAVGVPLYAVSMHDETSLSPLAALLSPGRTAALIGSSGAGKSTLLNRLYGEEIRSTDEVGSRVGKGKHTTTSRDLIVLAQGGMVIDNPGIREIGLFLGSEGSMGAFPDIEETAQLCKFNNCTHSHEPGCMVLEAVSRGEISPPRLESYHKLKNELSYHHQRENKAASRVEKERWKGVAKKIKSIKRKKDQW